ncbi:putative glycoside hydrolase [bacterium]
MNCFSIRKFFKKFILLQVLLCSFVLLSHAANFDNPSKFHETYRAKKPKYVRGIHLSAWSAGSKKFREALDPIFRNTEINTAVIAVKEANGEVYIPGIKKAEEMGAYVKAIRDTEEYIKYLHDLGIYVVARIVLFKDPILAKKEYYWAVHDPKGNIWKDYKGQSWVDPYNKRDVWEYNFQVADRCVELGFDEIQFDYVRFPSDGEIKNCRYIQDHSTKASTQAIAEFLKEAQKRYTKKYGIPIAADVFGLTTSASNDLGIGQIIEKIEPFVDSISPMVYPSHYKENTYGIPIPNEDPYTTVYLGMKYGKEKLGEKSYKFRPYLQDFSLGYEYGAKEVRAQIQAVYDNDIPEWILWDPKVTYSVGALKPKKYADKYSKSKSIKLNISSSVVMNVKE